MLEPPTHVIYSSSHITPKMPEFLMSKFKRPQTKRLKTDADSTQPKVLGTKYALDAPAQKTHFKLFGVPQQTAPRSRKCNLTSRIAERALPEKRNIQRKCYKERKTFPTKTNICVCEINSINGCYAFKAFESIGQSLIVIN
ncbi:hypothetical protein CEXT_272551 [Caerostris extrusa]|uniref:Uncharacterized protein n=1 Tax=Caerostris extrusa TaxID=172846 RepID=A0AAV4N4R2_CAEEX|nr:hypothetical protein CEXT_272551 [Caerostris extrusa]